MAPVSLDRAAVGKARSHGSKEPPLQPPLAKLLLLHVGGLKQSRCFLQVSVYSQDLHLGVSCWQRPSHVPTGPFPTPSLLISTAALPPSPTPELSGSVLPLLGLQRSANCTAGPSCPVQLPGSNTERSPQRRGLEVSRSHLPAEQLLKSGTQRTPGEYQGKVEVSRSEEAVFIPTQKTSPLNISADSRI